MTWPGLLRYDGRGSVPSALSEALLVNAAHVSPPAVPEH